MESLKYSQTFQLSVRNKKLIKLVFRIVEQLSFITLLYIIY